MRPTYEYIHGGEAGRCSLRRKKKSLIRRVRLWNDRKAAGELIGKYYDEIYAYTYRQTLEKQLAMDLTQEIFISVLQSIGDYKTKKSSFRTWLYRIASRRVAFAVRERRSGMRSLACTCKKGRSLFLTQLGAAETTALLVILAQLGAFWALYALGPHRVDLPFFSCGLDDYGWWNITFG